MASLFLRAVQIFWNIVKAKSESIIIQSRILELRNRLRQNFRLAQGDVFQIFFWPALCRLAGDSVDLLLMFYIEVNRQKFPDCFNVCRQVS